MFTLLDFECASRILGKGEPELVSERYANDRWRATVEQQPDTSGLPHVMQKLTRDMVDNTRENALINETEDATHLLRGLRKRTGYVVIDLSSCNQYSQGLLSAESSSMRDARGMSLQQPQGSMRQLVRGFN